MSAENFKILKEINSLTTKVNEINDLVSKESKRLRFIEGNRIDRQDEMTLAQKNLDHYKKDMTKIENEISTLSAKIDKDKESLQGLSEESSITSMEKQIAELETKRIKLEDEIFVILEKAEAEEQNIKEAQSFLEGSLRSLNEIKKDVNAKNEGYQKELDSLLNRVGLLKESLPIQFQTKLEQVLSKKVQISSFTRIKSNTCEFCKRDISRMEETEIEQKLALKTCQGCGRIFIPAAASF